MLLRISAYASVGKQSLYESANPPWENPWELSSEIMVGRRSRWIRLDDSIMPMSREMNRV